MVAPGRAGIGLGKGELYDTWFAYRKHFWEQSQKGETQSRLRWSSWAEKREIRDCGTSAGHVTFKRGSLDRERIPEVYTENQC